MISLRNTSRQPACYELTLECICDALPAATVIRMKTVYSESYPHRASSIAETVKAPPTLTIAGRETRKGLPDAVAAAPEIVAAIAAGHLVVIREEGPAQGAHTLKRPESSDDVQGGSGPRHGKPLRTRGV